MELNTQVLARIDSWIMAHPGYTRQDVEQPEQGHTNCICTVRGPGGSRDGRELAVIKVFCEAERKARECFGLAHWQATELVPWLIDDVDETMIVMSHVPGMMLHVSREAEGEEAWSKACREVGYAAGRLALVPLAESEQRRFESTFYRGRQLPTLEAYLRGIYAFGVSAYERNAEFRDVFWRNNLSFIASKIPDIVSEEPVLYHQDASNLHVSAGRFQGFFDLEMCRVGCASMQLASSMRNAMEGWENFREGWEAAWGRPLTLEERERACACAHLLDWRDISFILHPDAGSADPEKYKARIEGVRAALGIRGRNP